ncbi:MAG: hypothetical protein WD738_12075 [Pirellulales bacterium]
MLHQISRFYRLLLLVCVIGLVALIWPNVALAAGNLNLAAHKSRLQLDQPPSEPAQVLDVRKQFVAAKKQADAPKTREVVVTGQIGGMPNIWPETHPDYPWYQGQASFFLVDNKVAAQFAAHVRHHGGGEACAFCKSLAAKNAHAVAVVNLVDEQGQILRVDSREVLDLKQNQTVTIRGKAKLLAGSMLVIDADGIFVPR